jgi:hypothetical protein
MLPVARFLEVALEIPCRRHTSAVAAPRRIQGRNGKDWKNWTDVRPDLIDRIDLGGLAERWGGGGIITNNPENRVQRAHFLHNRWTRQVEVLTSLRVYVGLDLIAPPLFDRALAEFCLAIPPEQFDRWPLAEFGPPGSGRSAAALHNRRIPARATKRPLVRPPQSAKRHLRRRSGTNGVYSSGRRHSRPSQAEITDRSLARRCPGPKSRLPPGRRGRSYANHRGPFEPPP